MASLLVLGSKPDPCLPPPGSYDALACANASGASAARLGLPAPAFTVMSAVLTSGRKAPNRLALTALRGLRTGRLHFYPRPARGRTPWARLRHRLEDWRCSPAWFRLRLAALGYRYERFLDPGLAHYLDLAAKLCAQDAEVLACMARKSPSTGLIALALGLAEGGFERIIVSGFSFEITHDYADNPLIDDRGTAESRHADTDIALLRCLARRFGSIYTTEAVVHERAAVPLWPETAVDESRRPSAAAS